MMTTTCENLASAISDVIEELTLMIVEPSDVLPEDWCPELKVSIGFDGPVNGRLILLSDGALCDSVAANLLGSDLSDPEVLANAHDAVGELLNVVCGNLVTRVFDSQRAFALTLPEVEPIDRQQCGDSVVCQGGDLQEQCVLLLDDSPAMFILEIDQENSKENQAAETESTNN